MDSDVLVVLSDTEDSEEDEQLKECCDATREIVSNMANQMKPQSKHSNRPNGKQDDNEGKFISDSMRSFLAKRLEAYLDKLIEVEDVYVKDERLLLKCKKRIKLTSTSNITLSNKLKGSDLFLSNRRKPIPILNPSDYDFTSFIDPNFDITSYLKQIKDI